MNSTKSLFAFDKNLFFRSETDKSEFVLGQLLCLEASGGSSSAPPVINKCHEMGGDQEWKHRKMVTIFFLH